MEAKDLKSLESGRWYPVSKNYVHVCCGCGMKHDVEMKVDKAGRIWIKWTSLEDGEVVFGIGRDGRPWAKPVDPVKS